jgi:predicted transposase YdaD
MTKQHTPHDSLVKYGMGQPAVVREFFQAFLPAQVLAQIQLDTIQPTQDHFVDHKLSRFYADCLYEAKFGQDTGYLYLLVEHQSTVDPLMAFRIWHYIFQIWDRHVRSNPKANKLPLVWPLLLFSGRNPYNKSTDLRDLIQGPRELVNLLFDQPVALVDLKNIPDERLKEWGHMAVYLLPLKHAFDTMPFQEILAFAERYFQGAPLKNTLMILLSYFSAVREDLDLEDLVKWAQEAGSPALKETTMTLAEKLKREGKAEGIHEGIAVGRAEGKAEGEVAAKMEIARNLLRAGIDARFVAANTGLGMEQVHALLENKH